MPASGRCRWKRRRPSPRGTPGAELRTALDDAFAGLPRDLREAFLLHHRDGWSYDEMAGITGASVSALKMRVHRARDALRLALDDAGVPRSM